MARAPQLRGQPVVEAILAATEEELEACGYAGFSIEAVAARAGVNKTTVYRRWPTKDELILALMVRVGGAIFDIPDSGSFARDLVEVATRLGAALRTPTGRALYLTFVQHGLGIGEPEENRLQLRSLFERATKRGELPKSADVELLIAAFIGTTIQFALFGPVGSASDRERAERIVAHVLCGVTPRGDNALSRRLQDKASSASAKCSTKGKGCRTPQRRRSTSGE